MISGKRIDSEPLAGNMLFFAQGARCGHIEGKGRAGSYVDGEEKPLAFEAACVNVPGHTRDVGHRRDAWKAGYEFGYQLAAEGEPLPPQVTEANLPPFVSHVRVGS